MSFCSIDGGSATVLWICGKPHSGYIAVCLNAVTVAPEGLCVPVTQIDFGCLTFAVSHFATTVVKVRDMAYRTRCEHWEGVRATQTSIDCAQQGGKLNLHERFVWNGVWYSWRSVQSSGQR